jgi:hypothetical protein
MKKALSVFLVIIICALFTIPAFAEGMETNTVSYCPRCGIGVLVSVCSGTLSGYNYGTCWTAGIDHPYNCQVHQTLFYTDTMCSNTSDCTYRVSGVGSHIQSYYHTLYPSCYDDHYCQY